MVVDWIHTKPLNMLQTKSHQVYQINQRGTTFIKSDGKHIKWLNAQYDFFIKSYTIHSYELNNCLS